LTTTAPAGIAPAGITNAPAGIASAGITTVTDGKAPATAGIAPAGITTVTAIDGIAPATTGSAPAGSDAPVASLTEQFRKLPSPSKQLLSRLDSLRKVLQEHNDRQDDHQADLDHHHPHIASTLAMA
jgi:hypothetical protein